MSPTKLLSICICTHNRADDARECLAALVGQVDFDIAEIIVIDSASAPEEQAKLETLRVFYPQLIFIRLEQPGLSIARNAGVAATKGQWVAFLDDDAVPFPDYFSQAVNTLRKMDEKVGLWGGRLKPRWPSATPPAIGLRWQGMLSLIDDDTPEREAEAGLIYGANVFYRADILSRFDPPFDPSLGRIGKCLLSGEETHLHSAIKEMDYLIRFYGKVGAEHKIAPQRLTHAWLKQRAYWDGITLVAVYKARKRPYPQSANPWRQALKIAVLLPKALIHDADKEAYARIWISLGVIRARLLGIPNVSV